VLQIARLPYNLYCVGRDINRKTLHNPIRVANCNAFLLGASRSIIQVYIAEKQHVLQHILYAIAIANLLYIYM